VESLNLVRERLLIDGLSLSILRPRQADALSE